MLFVMMAQVLAFNTPQTAKAEKTGGGGAEPSLGYVAETVLDIRDFGGDASGKNDSTVPIQKALEEAKKIDGPVRLFFPKGEYHVYKDFATQRDYHTSNTSSLGNPTKWIGILIEDQKDLTIDGGGSTFIMHGDIMALAVVRSENVVLENFVLDYEVPDTVDITIAETGSESGKPYTDMYIPANYNYEITEDGKHINWSSEISPFSGRNYWSDKDTFGAYLVIYKGYDETVRRHNTTFPFDVNGDGVIASGETAKDADPFIGLESIKSIGDNKLRFTYSSRRPEAQEEGNVYLLCNSARRRTAGAFIWESTKTTVRNVDVHYLSGFGWLTQMSKDTEFNGVDFLPREGTGKYTTSNADQIHVSGASGYFNVIDCDFSMAHDDPINIHGTYLRVEEVIDNKTLKLKYIHSQQGGYPAYFPGDEIMFYSRLNLEVPTGAREEDTFTVASAVDPGEEYEGSKLSLRETVVTFDKAFPDDVFNALKVKIKRNAAAEEEPLYVAENVTYAPNVHIKGNIMRSIPTRGILCTTKSEVIIEDNIFESLAMASLYLSNDADYWYESGPIRNMTIRNNTFNVRPTGQTEWATVSPIFVDPVIVNSAIAAPGFTLPPVKGDPVHKNITVEGNIFNMRAFNLVTAKGVDGLTFKDNQIFRDTNEMEISLTTDKNNLSIGEEVAIKADVKEETLETDAFIFEKCKNIKIENNSYDYGMNMNVKTDPATNGQVTITDDPLTINGSANVITAQGNVQYVSLNPEIVEINKDGKAVAKAAGTAQIIAFCKWKDSLVRSIPIAITVGSGSALPEYTIAGTDTITATGTYNYTVPEIIRTLSTMNIEATSGSGVEVPIDTLIQNPEEVKAVSRSAAIWSVADALTDKPTKAATIDAAGVLTANSDGIIKVIANINGKPYSKLVVITMAGGSYGVSKNGMSSEMDILFPVESNWKGNGDKDQFTIRTLLGDMYGGAEAGKPPKNITTFKVPVGDAENVRIQVTIDNLPKGKPYDAAGLLLYKDTNNYIRVGKKGHVAKIGVDNEVGGSDAETSFGEELTGTKAAFELSNENGIIYAKYKDLAVPEKGWSESYKVGTNTGLGNDYKIAFAAFFNNGTSQDYIATFSDLKIGQASSIGTAALEMSDPIPFFTTLEANAAPTVTVPTYSGNLLIGETITANYTYADSDNHAQGGSLFEWIYTNDGKTVIEYTQTPTFVAKEKGLHTCKVYVLDEYNKPCTTPGTSTFTIAESTETTLDLNGIWINGNIVKDFEKNKVSYNYPIPAEAARASIDYRMVNSAHGTSKLTDSAGNILDKDGFLVPADGIVKIVRSKDAEIKEYVIHFKVYQTNKAGITDIKIADQNCKLIRNDRKGYYVAVNNETNIAKLSFTTDLGVRKVEVKRSFYNNPIAGTLSGTAYTTGDVNLYSGLNIFNVFVTAADDSVTQHIVQVFRSGFSDCDAQDITLNGTTIVGFDKDTTDYRLNINSSEATSGKLAVVTEAGKDITTNITVNGELTEGNTVTLSNLKTGVNEVVVNIVSENLWTRKHYILNIIVATQDNNSLLNLETEGIRFTPGFSGDVTTYSAKTSNSKTTVTAVAQLANAKIKINAWDQKHTGTGQASGEINLYEGNNVINVQVTAPNGTKKAYVLNIECIGEFYLSDLVPESVNNGYGQLGYDVSNSGGNIKLPDTEGNPVTFEKGLGAHATAKLVYDIEGKGYLQFKSFVGIDYVQYGTDGATSSVNFKVYIDEETEEKLAWESGIMERKTPMKEVTVDVATAKKLILVADSMGANSYDHADWADAKLMKPYGQGPEIPDEPDEPDEPEKPVDPGNGNTGGGSTGGGTPVKPVKPGTDETTEKIAKPTDTEATITSSGNVSAQWEKVKDADGYRIYIYNENTNKFEYLKQTKLTKYVIKNPEIGKQYIFRVRAIKKTGTGYEFGPYSDNMVVTPTLKVPDISKVTRLSSNKATISWDKVKSADGYRVYVYNSKKKKYDYAGTTKSTKFTITAKGAAKVRIRAFVKQDGKISFSKYTAPIIIK